MYLIDNISDDPSQTRTLNLPDGTKMSFTMDFYPLEQGWFITALTWKDFSLNGYRIFTHPNMLSKFKNQLTWGLGCFTESNREPYFQTDFSTGVATLYILDSIDVETLEEHLSNNGQT